MKTNQNSPLSASFTFHTFLFSLTALLLTQVCFSQIVINQIYATDGGSGSFLNAAFVQLVNQSNSPVSMNGYSLQFRNTAGIWIKIDLPNGTLNAGQSFVIGGKTYTNGARSFSPNLTNSNLILLPTGGTVAVMTNNTLNNSCPSTSVAATSDLVGYGTATCFEQNPLPALSNVTAFYRKSNTGKSNSNQAAFALSTSPNPLSPGLFITLPIRLQSFAGVHAEGTNQLQWQASLTGPSSFEVERSENGNAFTTIGVVNGHESTLSSFAYTDAQPVAQKEYYRLKMTDEIGGETYSNTIVLEGTLNTAAKARLYPTIATTQVTMALPLRQSQDISYSIVSIDGRVCATSRLTTGQPQRNIDVTGLNNGQYLVQLSIAGTTQTLRFLKQ